MVCFTLSKLHLNKVNLKGKEGNVGHILHWRSRVWGWSQSLSSHLPSASPFSNIFTPKPSHSRGSFLWERSLSQHVLPTCHPQPGLSSPASTIQNLLYPWPAGFKDKLSVFSQVRAWGQSWPVLAKCVQLMLSWPSTKHISLTSSHWVLARVRDCT